MTLKKFHKTLQASTLSIHKPEIPVAEVSNQVPEDLEHNLLEQSLTVAAIGASAGGFDPIKDLIRNIEPGHGIAFVIIQHLPPDNKHLLQPLIQATTKMCVEETEHNTKAQEDHVYISPPNKYLGMSHGRFQHIDPLEKARVHLPIDYFFKALAHDLTSRAVGVVLSGTGNDGTLGAQEIREKGGIVFAQEPTSSTFKDMPANAINANAVDMIMAPNDIAKKLIQLAHQQSDASDQHLEPTDTQISKIVFLLRNSTGRDFSYYKKTTVARRVKSRMLLLKINSIEQYIQQLQSNPSEADKLLNDLLINVTGFFRDPDSYKRFEKIICPALVNSNREIDNVLRVWIPACSTGQEAYSIAITLLEYMKQHEILARLQILATDIDKQAINVARAGIYSDAEVIGVSPERLNSYFTRVIHGYKINREIRDLCIFAEQDVLVDPPFSKVDLISCRNLLIYLEPHYQRKLFTIFNFALKPTGFLVLGMSEVVNKSADLFSLMDKKFKFYSKKETQQTFKRTYNQQSSLIPLESENAKQAAFSLNNIQITAEKYILKTYSPAAMIIDQHFDVLAFMGSIGPLMEPAPGMVSLKLQKLLNKDLVIPVTRALNQAVANQGTTVKTSARFRTDKNKQTIPIIVQPLTGPRATTHCFLVIFEKPIDPTGDITAVSNQINHTDSKLKESELFRQLEQELDDNRQELHSIISEQADVNEDLQAANEEIQASNEELQSTIEELESAKEELQSTNEELSAVNEELQDRNTQLAEINADLNNLLGSISFPVIMLNEDLSIRQFTVAASKLFNLIESDIGRPFTDLRLNHDIQGIEQDINEVSKTLESKTRETQDAKGNWYSLNVRPYLSLDKRITGSIMTFFDITHLKQDPLQSRQLAYMLKESKDAIIISSPTGEISNWNKGAEGLYGYEETEACKLRISDLMSADEHAKFRNVVSTLSPNESSVTYTAARLTKNRRVLSTSRTVSGFFDSTERITTLCSIERNIESS